MAYSAEMRYGLHDHIEQDGKSCGAMTTHTFNHSIEPFETNHGVSTLWGEYNNLSLIPSARNSFLTSTGVTHNPSYTTHIKNHPDRISGHIQEKTPVKLSPLVKIIYWLYHVLSDDARRSLRWNKLNDLLCLNKSSKKLLDQNGTRPSQLHHQNSHCNKRHFAPTYTPRST